MISRFVHLSTLLLVGGLLPVLPGCNSAEDDDASSVAADAKIESPADKPAPKASMPSTKSGNASTQKTLELLKSLGARRVDVNDNDVIVQVNFDGTSIDGFALQTLSEIEDLAKIESLRLSQTAITDAGLVHIAKFTRLKELVLDYTKIQGRGLSSLTGLSELRDLHLYKTSIDDEGLQNVAQLKQLEGLSLGGSLKITDRGIQSISQLTELKKLVLGGLQITDTSVKHLTVLQKLERVGLSSSQITDAGVLYLEQISNIKLLSLTTPRVSRTAIEHLKSNMPDCKVVQGK